MRLYYLPFFLIEKYENGNFILILCDITDQKLIKSRKLIARIDNCYNNRRKRQRIITSFNILGKKYFFLYLVFYIMDDNTTTYKTFFLHESPRERQQHYIYNINNIYKQQRAIVHQGRAGIRHSCYHSRRDSRGGRQRYEMLRIISRNTRL